MFAETKVFFSEKFCLYIKLHSKQKKNNFTQYSDYRWVERTCCKDIPLPTFPWIYLYVTSGKAKLKQNKRLYSNVITIESCLKVRW